MNTDREEQLENVLSQAAAWFGQYAIAYKAADNEEEYLRNRERMLFCVGTLNHHISTMEDLLADMQDSALRQIIEKCHAASVAGGWWHDLETKQPLKRNKGELLMLIVSEIAEAMEGERKSLMDDKLPHRAMAEVEMADATIRIFDYCGAHGYDLVGAINEKLAYNAQRADHKPENRAKSDGKKF